MANNNIILAAERNFRALDPDAATGCRLPGNRDAAFDRDFRAQCDVAAHIKNNDAIGHAHGIAKRARAAVSECGDVIHRTGPAAAHVGAKTLRAGKSRLLSLKVVGSKHCC